MGAFSDAHSRLTMLTRRDLVWSSVSLLGPLLARRSIAGPPSQDALKVDLVQEFADAQLLAVSPDGTKLCLRMWKGTTPPRRVVEVGTWRTVCTDRFPQTALEAGFFADGQALFFGFTGGAGQLEHRQAVVDIRTGERTERMHPYDPFNYHEEMSPIDDRTLLAVHYAFRVQAPWRMEWLARLEFPSYRDLMRVTLPAERADPKPDVGLMLSHDRRFALYFFDDALICRRTEDLEVLWTHPIDAELRPFPLAVSAHGDYMAATVNKGTREGRFERDTPLYISVYQGKDGAEVARLLLNGKWGIALSPDGKLIAVIAREPGKKGEILPTIHIHEVSSGRRLTSRIHDRIRKGRRQFLEAGCGAAFTSDGKYLITSGMVTKVWTIGA
jgi:hypothetical protein